MCCGLNALDAVLCLCPGLTFAMPCLDTEISGNPSYSFNQLIVWHLADTYHRQLTSD